MYCDSSGEPVPENAPFCSNCGSQIKPVGSPSDRLQIPAISVNVPPPGEPASPDGPNGGITPIPHAAAACSFPGCTGIAVGTCAGYKISCPNLLCATHTDASLCPECTERKHIDDCAERVYADYQQKAEWIKHETDDWLKSLALIGVVLDSLIMFPLLYSGQTTAYIIGSVVASAVGCVIFVVYYQNKRLLLAQTAEHNPGFTEFYRAWRKNKRLRRKDLADAGVVGAIALGVAANRVKEQHQTQLPDDTRSIHEDLGKI